MPALAPYVESRADLATCLDMPALARRNVEACYQIPAKQQVGDYWGDTNYESLEVFNEKRKLAYACPSSRQEVPMSPFNDPPSKDALPKPKLQFCPL
jgi:hypothetical protein